MKFYFIATDESFPIFIFLPLFIELLCAIFSIPFYYMFLYYSYSFLGIIMYTNVLDVWPYV